MVAQDGGMELPADLARQRFAGVMVARLATVGPDGRPHLVPITFAVQEDRIYTAVDHKPKRTTNLRRLRNIAANPHVAVLADHYEADWQHLWWVRAEGVARVVEHHAEGTRLLSLRYPQYRTDPPPGPVIVISAERWSGWSASLRLPHRNFRDSALAVRATIGPVYGAHASFSRVTVPIIETIAFRK